MGRRITEREGIFSWMEEDQLLVSFHGEAYHEDGRCIDTRKSRECGRKLYECEDAFGRGLCLEITFQAENGLTLREQLTVYDNGTAAVRCILQEQGNETAAARLLPTVTEAPGKEGLPLLQSLRTKMLLTPYDNTMWARYEAVPPRPGRCSYDLTVLYSEDSREGMLLGAADFDIWKNAVVCSGADARVWKCVSGVADSGTHDSCPHGILRGKEAASSRFLMLYGKDYRTLLEDYGSLLNKDRKPMKWDGGVPFGWNSWSGLAMEVNEDNYRGAGDFLGDTLKDLGYQNNNTSYVNFDAGWHKISGEKRKELCDYYHDKGMKTGIYLSPFAFFQSDEYIGAEIPGAPGHVYEEILLKDRQGKLLPRVDGAIPLDVTHPVWKQQVQKTLEEFVRQGFDYVKLDFLSHGGMEGAHYDRECMTGRQALMKGYEFLAEQLSEEKAGRPVFLSLSIAPLFPQGMGHARRFSCDAFGTAEDTEYVLNALTYAWWQSGTLYCYNDPDHISLYRSFACDRRTTFGEAKVRYTSAAISGTVMMLSEDFGEAGKELSRETARARQRAEELCRNREIREIAASGISFRPAESAGTGAAGWYTARIGENDYVAVFHLRDCDAGCCLELEKAGICGICQAEELWSGTVVDIQNDILRWEFEGVDAAVFRLKRSETQVPSCF